MDSVEKPSLSCFLVCDMHSSQCGGIRPPRTLLVLIERCGTADVSLALSLPQTWVQSNNAGGARAYRSTPNHMQFAALQGLAVPQCLAASHAAGRVLGKQGRHGRSCSILAPDVAEV